MEHRPLQIVGWQTLSVGSLSGYPRVPVGAISSIMVYHSLADTVLIVHLAFVVFVVAGGLLVLRWRRLAWVHLPAVLWGILIEYAGWVCPLTPLENALRRRAGEAGYAGGFIEHYLVALLYPGGLTRRVQIGLGTVALAINVVVYARLWVLMARRGQSGVDDSA